MPSGKPVDWAQYDELLHTYVPTMTIAEFGQRFLPHISAKAIGTRCRNLHIKPKRRNLTDEQRQAISDRLSTATPELIAQIKNLRDSMSRVALAKHLNLPQATLARIIKKHKIGLSQQGKTRAMEATRRAHLGKIPWNKDGHLSDQTRRKISEAVSGDKNGQYGRGMTEEEKEKWRKSYFAGGGIDRMRQWLKSADGLRTMAKTIATLKSVEFRAASSQRATELLNAGKLKINRRYKSGYHESPKAGRVYYRSSYELRYYKMLDTNDQVINYIVEPLTIEYLHFGIPKNYTPGAIVLYQNGDVVLVEVKPKRMLEWDKNQAKISAATTFCGKYRLRFAVVTEDDLI